MIAYERCQRLLLLRGYGRRTGKTEESTWTRRTQNVRCAHHLVQITLHQHFPIEDLQCVRQ